MAKDYLERIAIDPSVMVGKPVIRSIRIPIELVVRQIGQGMPINEILQEHPRLCLTLRPPEQ